MFLETAKFELNFHRQQYLVYILSGILFLLFFLAMASPNVQIGGGGPNVNLNGSMPIVNMLGGLSVVAILVSIAFTANSVVRDYDYKSIELFLSRPLQKGSFIYGRFVGSFVFGVLVYLAGAFGILLGEWAPWLDPERLGPTNLPAYLYGTLVFGLPNLFVFSSIFFCVAAMTRSLGWTYGIAIALLMLTTLLDTFTERDTVQLISMLDPMGSTAMEEVTRYWTPFELNSSLPAFSGALALNRALWVLIALGFLTATFWLFPDTINRRRKPVKQKAKTEITKPAPVAIPVIEQRFNATARLAQLWSQVKVEVRGIVFSVPFPVAVLLGMAQVVGATAGDLGNIVGTSLLPTTSNMITVINGAFTLPLLVVLVYLSAEMMGREAATKSNELLDAMPYPNWIMIAAKWIGLSLVIVMMLIAVMLAAIGVQLYKGFTDIDVLQYLVGLLFFFQFPIFLTITLSLFVYTLTRNRFAAMFLMVVYFVFLGLLPALDFQHFLYRMTQINAPYSDFTGYAQNLVPHLWLTLYWSVFGCLMLLAVHLLWPRGIEDTWATRLKVARLRLTQPAKVTGFGLTLLFVGLGGFIYYNTNILNEYITLDSAQARQADYEKMYKQYENLPQLQITKVYAEVDIFPEEQEVEVAGTYQLVNRTAAPITELHMTDPLFATEVSLELPEAELNFDARLLYRIYKLAEPIAPGEAIQLKYRTAWRTPGFANFGNPAQLAKNGTFFNNIDIFPLLGYQARAELQNNNDRRDYDLPPLQRLPDLDDEAARWANSAFGGDRVDFETIVSTHAGQIALAPGYLQRDWQEGDRHYFHYKMDQPIWNFFSFLSADYSLKTDSWNDVAIEVYYKHDYNVESMIESTKDSLDYFSKNFSPYQYRQFRIMEFPEFQGRFAQSFPNTIPFSEAIGFTADLRDESRLNYVYYVTAHELAHQWWAHQVLGANVQGSTLIIETLAQYSALMVMEKKFGRAHMQRFLEFELDNYLRGRGSEAIEELPLFRVEDQPYIHYRKGSVVFYALRDLIGEAAINDALAEFIKRYGFKSAPYPTTRDLLALIRERADDQYQETITDLFERIVLFDLKVNEVAMTELPNGKFEVSFDVIAKKYQADGEGVETEVPISDWIDVGVLGEENPDTEVKEIIHLEKVKMDTTLGRFSFQVEQKPTWVGIDPLNILVDRNPEDNLKQI